LGALDAWNFGFAAFVFGAWGLLLFVFWRFFGFASFLFFVLELWFCFFCVLHDGKLCICEVFFLLAFRGWRGKGNKLAVGKKTFPMVLVAWQVSSVSNQRAMDWRS
jgi:hypothetical protein